jgi:riboflavin synthase
MFTGIIEELGIVERIERLGDGARLKIQCRKSLEDSKEGSSIAVNGVCLTAVDLEASSFVADLAPETMRRSNLGDLRSGSGVNLERPLSISDRLSGHIVQGHVDGTGQLLAFEELGDNNWWMQVRIPPELDRYLVFKGSIAIDGISLTVAELRDDIIAITVIPHTYFNTTLGARKPGDRLNLECDILAKHVEKLLARMELKPELKPALTVAKLKELGY